jgi:AmiR/NasT family two-component response regulator
MTTDDSPTRALRLIAADEHPDALQRTAAMLEQLGHEVTACTASVEEACELIARDEPDAAVVVVHHDVEHALDLIDELSEVVAGPVIALFGEADAQFAEAAARRGLDAIASELTVDALQTAIEVAMRRHAERERLEVQVGQLEHALGRRAVIERAKGILMERHGLDEHGAFNRLRSEARSRNLTVVAVAQELGEPG